MGHAAAELRIAPEHGLLPLQLLWPYTTGWPVANPFAAPPGEAGGATRDDAPEDNQQPAR